MATTLKGNAFPVTITRSHNKAGVPLNMVEATAEAEATGGCDRHGCTKPITKGQAVKVNASSGRIFHQTGPDCDGVLAKFAPKAETAASKAIAEAEALRQELEALRRENAANLLRLQALEAGTATPIGTASTKPRKA